MKDFISMNILKKLKKISRSHQINLQWTSSHINISGNKVVEHFAKGVQVRLRCFSCPLPFQDSFPLSSSKFSPIGSLQQATVGTVMTGLPPVLNFIVIRKTNSHRYAFTTVSCHLSNTSAVASALHLALSILLQILHLFVF